MEDDNRLSSLNSKIESELKVLEGAKYMKSKVPSNSHLDQAIEDSLKRLSFLESEKQLLLSNSSTTQHVKQYTPLPRRHSKYNIFQLLRSKSESNLEEQREATTNFSFLISNTFITREKVQFLLLYCQNRLQRELLLKQEYEELLKAQEDFNSSRLSIGSLQNSTINNGRFSISSNPRSIRESYRIDSNHNLMKSDKDMSRDSFLSSSSKFDIRRTTEKHKASVPLTIEQMLSEIQTKIYILNRSLITLQSLESSTQSPKLNAIEKFCGKLNIQIFNILLQAKQSDSSLYCKIMLDGLVKATTKPAKKWDEDLMIYVKEKEMVEIGVYEQGLGLLGMIWFSITDLKEEIEQVNSISGKNQNYVNTYLDLFPTGKIHVQITLTPAEQKRSTTSMLTRAKNVPKLTMKMGHKFLVESSLNVVKCAICNEFVLGRMNRCQRYEKALAFFQVRITNLFSCDFTIHKKCMGNVVAKCISKYSNGVDNDDKDDIAFKHNISHRWIQASHMGIYWCGHCGKVLWKSGYDSCVECGMNCHQDCSSLVPDLCGLPKELMIELRSLENFTTSDTKGTVSKGHSPRMDKKFSSRESSPNISSKIKKAPKNVNGIVPDHERTESLQYFKNGRKGVGLDDFTFLAVLGKGNFGKVMLAQERYTNNLYGIKVLKKEFILEHDEVASTKSEKRCFQIASKESHPFLVNLHSCFQTESRLYFVMEYVSGGDLMWHIQHKKFTPAQAKFYACEVLIAIEYWHSNNILYRDLKLDNIFDGHIKIADYGLCKENMGFGNVTNTFCGTPEFMAPEILAEQPYSRAVDWWSFGVLLYEMLLGKAPFNGDDEEKIFNAITKGTPVYPSHLSTESVDLLKKLLVKDPRKRLGCLKSDAKPIKEHEYFKDIDWNDVFEKKIPVPYLPELKDKLDLSNFDEEFTQERPVLTPVHSVLSNVAQEEFRGFTYVSEWAKQTRAAFSK